jgi:hypothetical protein
VFINKVSTESVAVNRDCPIMMFPSTGKFRRIV